MENNLRKVTTLVEFDPTGEDGNAFSLMGAFRRAAKQQDTPKEEIDAVISECKSGDYNHLLSTIISNSDF